jgi:hypothetical protein
MGVGNLRGEAHPRAKLTNDEVIKIRKLYRMGFSTNVISRNFKISKWNIEEIIRGRTWKHLL